MKCDWCDWRGADADQLLDHIRKNHAPTQAASCSKPHTPKTVVGFECVKCNKDFKAKRSLTRHERESHSTQQISCDICQVSFKNLRTLKNHSKIHSKKSNNVKKRRDPLKHKCRICKEKFKSIFLLYSHKRICHPTKRSKHDCDGCWRRFSSSSSLRYHINGCVDKRMKTKCLQKVREFCASKSHAGEVWNTESVLDGDARVHDLVITDENDLQLTLLQNKDGIRRILQKDLQELHRVKWYLSAFIRCQETDDSNVRYMRCTPITTLLEEELNVQIQDAILGVLNSFDKAQGEGSRILFERVEKLELRVAKYVALKGSSYIPLPEKFRKSSKGLVNIQNFDDDKCFLYSCLAGIDLPLRDAERVTKYRHRMDELDMRGISYPVKISQISKFEEQNTAISVNVFGLEEETDVVPIRISKEIKDCHINLLLLRDEDEEDENHYVLIKSMSRFLAHLTKRDKQLHWCENCLTPFDNPNRYTEHRQRCIVHDPQVVKMPSPRDAVMRFQQYGNQMHHDFCIYADFEAIVVPNNAPHPDPASSSTTRTSLHVPSGFCYIVVKADGTLLKPPVLRYGECDIIKQFLLCLQEEEENITTLRGDVFEIDMSEEQEKEFQEANVCYMCGDPVPRSGVKKVRDHDWSKPTQNFRGAACQAPCNLNLKRKTYIPVFMHNLKNYDAHMILNEIGQLSDGSDLKVVPRTKEKYVSFQWGLLRFLDSLGFLNSSLDKLVADLSDEDMSLLETVFPDKDDRVLVGRKGVYPYSYFDSFDKFTETCLPPQEAFRNDLTGLDVTPEDYQHACNVYQHFKMSTLQDYHNLYLLTDTVLLADCMETFRKMAMEHYKLDPVHYYTTPGMAFSASLLFTKQRLELLDDLETHLIFERGMRGGVASIQERFIQANNRYIPETYTESKPTSFIMYYDANALYSTALCAKLPTGYFRDLTASEIDEFDPEKINPDSDLGYLFVVDLVYPKELHDLHNHYPLAPEHMVPEYKNLSRLQKKMIRDFQLSKKSTKKLVPNLYDKENYVVYGDTLLLYLELGLRLKKIHKVIEFEQSAWLKPFITHNIEMRKLATSDFQKSFWKLMNNSVFGKTCEAVRKHRNVVLTKERQKFRKLVRSPLFHSFEVFNHGLVCVERRKSKIVLNRPLYIGQVCLDISKKIMYDFYYNVLKVRYGNNIKVAGGDTDSIIVEILTEDVYADMYEMREYFDTSDYPKNHPLYSLENKKVMGKFTDELGSEPIHSFVGLRAKMYSFKTVANKEKSVGKGIPRAAMKSQLSFSDYEKCITLFKEKNVAFNKIATDRKHGVFTTHCVKKGLSCYDDKRFILDDNFSTLAHGHYKIKSINATQNDECDSDTDDDDEGARNLRDLVLLQEEMSL